MAYFACLCILLSSACDCPCNLTSDRVKRFSLNRRRLRWHPFAMSSRLTRLCEVRAASRWRVASPVILRCCVILEMLSLLLLMK